MLQPRMRVDFPHWEKETQWGGFRVPNGLKPEIKGEVKARQPRNIAAAISFARIQEEWLNQDARKTRTTPRPTAYKPPSIPSRPSLPKKMTREELRDRSAKGLCWHCDEPWSCDHRCKKDCLLLIEPLEDVEEVQEHEEEVTDEEEQPVDITMHALAGYANPQTIEVGGFLKQQPITVLIDTESTNNFINSKVPVRMALPIEDCCKFNVKVANGRILKLGLDVRNKVCNFDLYRPVRAIHTDPPGYRYTDRPLPGGSVKNRPSKVDFGRRRSISTIGDRLKKKSNVGGRLREKSTVDSRLRKKKGRRRGKKKRRGEERIPRPPTVAACGSPARRHRGRFFSRARRRSISPRGETNRGNHRIIPSRNSSDASECESIAPVSVLQRGLQGGGGGASEEVGHLGKEGSILLRVAKEVEEVEAVEFKARKDEQHAFLGKDFFVPPLHGGRLLAHGGFLEW
ncbi:hypothetical protein GW17_00004262 [Ensete ventricosum]|nr:hypothetical protein GW17_00004262 [Ensete ventricosum]